MAVVLLLVGSVAAQADTTIDTTPSWDGSNSLDCFGTSPSNTPTYGQTITAPAGSSGLTSFSFFINLPADVTFRGEVYAWDGTKATGPNLYESPPTHTAGSGGFDEVTFAVPNAILTAGQQYVLFASTDKDTNSDQTCGTWGMVSSDAYAGGALTWFNDTGASDWTTLPWDGTGVFGGDDFAFRATFVSESDLALTDAVAPQSVTAGQNVTYTLNVKNSGPDDAANTVLRDTLPASTTLVSATSSQGTCSGSATVSCALGTLASGAGARVTIVARTSAAGTITDAANVSSDSTDPNSSNNSASATATVTAKPPAAVTGAATSLTQTSAALNGTVNPNGSATTYFFEYGTSTAYGSATASHSAGSDTSNHSVSASISGLSPGRTYHFRIVAHNASGTSYGADKTFTTPKRPLKLSVSPTRARAGMRACFAFKTTSTGHPVAGVTIHLAGHTARTSHTGNATICVALQSGTYHPSATKRSYRTAHTTITATAAPKPTPKPSFTG